jgi:putative CocE/NonD family hydrolase
MRWTCWLLAVTALVLLASASPAAGAGDAEPPGIDLQWAAAVPMRDGVKLNATLYLPTKRKGPTPAVFTLTPYIADTYHERAAYFARHGYAFALVDARGRGNSAGNFEPFVNEARDGHDVVEWLARQPWCDGKVAMWGGSYAGFDQWATLKEFPPHLATIVPAAAAHPGVDFPAFQNIPTSYLVQWLTLTSGKTPNAKLFGDQAFWIAKYRQRYLEHRPFAELDSLCGNPSPHFQRWLQHPEPDAYFDAMAPAPEHYARMNLPILTITGHYDDDQAGALTYYERHMKLGSATGKARHYLLMGPWDHAGTRTPAREFGGLSFGEASALDLNALHREWYDWTMKTRPKPKFLQKRVAYYVAGADRWKYADSLDAVGAKPSDLYLHSGGSANDAFRSGGLRAEKPTHESADSYVYDPLDLRPAELEREEIKKPLTDQRSALNRYGNGVVYHSNPFPMAAEVSGRFKLIVWVALDVPDTDFQADVYEILLDGTSVLLASDLKRARYRESLRHAKRVAAGAILPYEFASFNWISRQVAKGSRLRLVLASPNTIMLEKNYNSGGAVARETGKDARTAHVRVFHDGEHPSRLEVPIVP